MRSQSPQTPMPDQLEGGLTMTQNMLTQYIKQYVFLPQLHSEGAANGSNNCGVPIP